MWTKEIHSRKIKRSKKIKCRCRTVFKVDSPGCATPSPPKAEARVQLNDLMVKDGVLHFQILHALHEVSPRFLQ